MLNRGYNGIKNAGESLYCYILLSLKVRCLNGLPKGTYMLEINLMSEFQMLLSSNMVMLGVINKLYHMGSVLTQCKNCNNYSTTVKTNVNQEQLLEQVLKFQVVVKFTSRYYAFEEVFIANIFKTKSSLNIHKMIVQCNWLFFYKIYTDRI